MFRSGRPSPNRQECFPVRKLGKKCKALLAGSEYRLIINTLLPFPAVSSMHQSLFLKENTSRPLTPQGEDLTCSRFDLKTFINPSFGRAEGQQVNSRGGRGGKWRCEHENDHLPRPFRRLCPLSTSSCGHNTSEPAVVRSLRVCSVTELFGAKLLVSWKFLKLEGGVSGCFSKPN